MESSKNATAPPADGGDHFPCPPQSAVQTVPPLPPSALSRKTLFGILGAGFFSLVVAMDVGRFAYTALLPGMMHTHGFGEGMAGNIAGWNYLGYLAGALCMRGVPSRLRYKFFTLWVAVNLVSTTGMGVLQGEVVWYVLRFLSGMASAGMFVLCSAMVLDTLAANQRPDLAGFFYSGVGAGIALSGSCAPLLEGIFGNSGAWAGLGLISLPLAGLSLWGLRPPVAVGIPPPSPSVAKPLPSPDSPPRAARFASVAIAYFLEGLGYIISATFLVALVRQSTQSAALADASWVLAGITAAVSTPLWPFVAARFGFARTLEVAFVLQGIGALLPALSPHPAAALAGGVLFGGTFIGITMLSLQYGVLLNARSSAHTIATLTILYGIGQILGPVGAGFLAEMGGGFRVAFALSSVCVFLGTAALMIGHRAGRGGQPAQSAH